MVALLISHRFNLEHGRELAAWASNTGGSLERIVLPEHKEARLSDADSTRVEAALFSGDVFPEYSRQFFSAARKAPNLKWLHVFNAGVDHPIYAEMLARGVRLTTSAGATAQSIAHTAIGALLMLARGFPHWIAAQRRHVWAPLEGADIPRDLAEQTLVVLGLGHIGREFARIARTLGLHVIGVRRSGARPDDPVDESHSPDRLAEILARADWLLIACPLTHETRGLIDARMLAALRRGAHVINVARGEIVDEEALIAALQSGHLAGAYLDVFEKEPLPPDSPLWEMPNVFVSPHNSSAASGNDARVYAIFQDNLERWMRGAPLVNEVHRAH